MGYRGRAYHRFHQVQAVTFASGAALSSAVDIGDYFNGYFVVPSAIQGATMKFQTSADGTTFVTARNAAGSADESVTIAASRGYAVPATVLQARYFKFSAVSTQTSPRTLNTILKS